MGKKIICTVTNDLNYDQRMIRICSSLAGAGYDVLLVGRRRPSSAPLKDQPFRQKRLPCFFDKGKLFYIEYNIRLFIFLIFSRADAYCAIDLDTILPVLFASKWRKTKRVYDAHELFCEMEEIVSRPMIYKIWKAIERYAVPQFKVGYTIGECYAEQFADMYQVNYEIVRNATVLKPLEVKPKTKTYILYQGAVNEGRSFETLIPAMQQVNMELMICGEGNYFEQAKALVTKYNLTHKIKFMGYVPPNELRKYTAQAYIGITLFTHQGKSNYYSMANRFFDYMHYGIPQLCVKFPEYVKVNAIREVAYLVDDTAVNTIANGLNTLIHDHERYAQIQQNCLIMREHYCWQEEEKKLLNVYSSLFE